MQFWKNITFAALYMIVEHIVGIYIYDNIRLPQILLESHTLLSVLLQYCKQGYFGPVLFFWPYAPANYFTTS